MVRQEVVLLMQCKASWRVMGRWVGRGRRNVNWAQCMMGYGG